MAKQNLSIVISAFDKTAKGLGSATRGIKAVAGAALNLKTALLGVAGVAGFGLVVKSSLQTTDQLAKTARKIGTTTEALSRMRYAAELTGVSTATMDMALQRFTRRTAEAAKGTGEAKGALRELNIDAKAMLNLPLDEQMKELSKAFETVKTPADKVRLAMKLFDSEGVALVNTLGLGKEALEEMMGEADALGIVLSRKAAQGVEDANDSFTRLRTLLRGFTDQTVAKLAPALELVTTKLVEFGKQAAGGDFEKIGETIANKIIDGFKNIVIVFQNILNVIGQTAHSIKQIYRNIFSSAETKKNELELKRLEQAAYKAGISISQALDPDSNYVERLSEANQQIVQDINRIKGELNRIQAVETEEYTPFDFSQLLADLEIVQEAIGKTTNAVTIDPPDITPVNLARESFKEWSDSIVPVDQQLKKLGTETMNGFTNALSGAVQGTSKLSDSFKSMAKSIVDSLTKMLVQYYITKPLFDFITGGVSGGTAGGTAGGTTAQPRANGGSVTKGQPYIVGERGHELFIPKQSGTIVPNHKLGASGSMQGGGDTMLGGSNSLKGGGDSIVVNQTINLTTGIQSTVRAEIQNMMPQINESTKAAVAEARARGGSYSKALLGV